MSLLDLAFEPCTMLDRTTAPDGYGGIETVYVPGATFEAAITKDSNLQARVAAVQGVTALYTITTRKSINLQYHDVFRRESDQAIFRVTENGNDRKTPPSASLNMRQVSAEEWKLPTAKAETEAADE